MTAFLTSIGYDHWVLLALLAVPLIGAGVIWLQGAATHREVGAAGFTRRPRRVSIRPSVLRSPGVADDAERAARSADILVNATTVGLHDDLHQQLSDDS